MMIASMTAATTADVASTASKTMVDFIGMLSLFLGTVMIGMASYMCFRRITCGFYESTRYSFTKICTHIFLSGLFFGVGGFLFNPSSESSTTSATSTTTPTPTPTPTTTRPAVNVGAPADRVPEIDVSGTLSAMVIALVAVVSIAVIGLLATMIRSALRKRAALKTKQDADRVVWAELIATSRELSATLLDYQKDLDQILRAPLMMDPSDPMVAAAYRDVLAAETLLDEHCPTLGMDESIRETAFAKAVPLAKKSLDAAIAKANNLGLSTLDPERAKTLKVARTLLAVVNDGNATPAERTRSMERLDKIMLTTFPQMSPVTIRAIETCKQTLAITAG